MARKTLDRKELRRASEAAETPQAQPKTKKKASPAGTPKRKSRSKSAAERRLKAFWGVFNQSMKRVAIFEYSQRKQADQKAAELSASQRTPHFVQIVKEEVKDA
jgi:hypothetical protein